VADISQWVCCGFGWFIVDAGRAELRKGIRSGFPRAGGVNSGQYGFSLTCLLKFQARVETVIGMHGHCLKNRMFTVSENT
jgi:hypothetical protein